MRIHLKPIIQPLQDTHLDAFVSFRNQASKESEYVNDIDTERARKMFNEWKGNKQAYVATVGPTIVGQLFFTAVKGKTFVNLISVLDAYKGTGLAKRLLDVIQSNHVELIVAKNNKRAIRFYESLGFKLDSMYNSKRLIFVRRT